MANKDHKYQQTRSTSTGKKLTEPTLNNKETKRIQSISGPLNYYSEIDPCIKPALNEIAREQAKPTLTTKRRTDHLLDYLATNPDATLKYDASDMILVIETDAAYLVQPKAKSRAAGWFVLTNKPSVSIKSNAPLHVICSTIKNRRRIRRRNRNRKSLPRLPTSLSKASTTSRTWTPSTSRWHIRIHRQSDSKRNFNLPMSTKIIKSIRYEILLDQRSYQAKTI